MRCWILRCAQDDRLSWTEFIPRTPTPARESDGDCPEGLNRTFNGSGTLPLSFSHEIIPERTWFEVPARRALINITPQVTGGAARKQSPGRALSRQCHAYHGRGVSSTTTKSGLHAISNGGWSASPRKKPPLAVRPQPHGRGPMPMRTSNAPSWAAKSSWAVTDGRLDFGPWEQIFYGEFDGRARKRALVKIIWRIAGRAAPEPPLRQPLEAEPHENHISLA